MRVALVFSLCAALVACGSDGPQQFGDGDSHGHGDHDPVSDGGDSTGGGDTLPSAGVTLPLCDGSGSRTLSELNGHQGAWIMTYAGWCSHCTQRAGTANALVTKYAEQDFEVYFIVTQDAAYNNATAAYCQSKATQFGWGANTTVLYDPNTDFRREQRVDGSGEDYVLKTGNVLYGAYHSLESTVEIYIRRALNLPAN